MNIFRRVLAAVDLSQETGSARVLAAACETLEEGDTLHIVTVVPDFGMSIVGSFFPSGHEGKMVSQAQDALHEFTKAHLPDGISKQHIVAHGNIYEEILAAAETVNADLIVVGTHPASPRDYVLGPNAERITRHAKCSVLAVR